MTFLIDILYIQIAKAKKKKEIKTLFANMRLDLGIVLPILKSI